MIAPRVATMMVQMNPPPPIPRRFCVTNPDEGTGDPDENRNYDPAGIVARHDQLAKRTGDQPDYDPDYDARYHFLPPFLLLRELDSG